MKDPGELVLAVVNESDLAYQKVCGLTAKIYAERVSVPYSHFPPFFVTCWAGGELQGAIGLTPANLSERLTAEEFFPNFNLLEGLSMGAHCDRRFLAEAGALTKTTEAPMEVITLLSAGVVVLAFNLGAKYLVFETNRVTVRHAIRMGWELTPIGTADFSQCDQDMQRDWAHYMKYPLEAFSVETDQAFPLCSAVINSLPSVQCQFLERAA